MNETASAPVVALAGGTGDLGGRIAKALVARGAKVRALVRKGADAGKLRALSATGAEIVEVDFHDPAVLEAACKDAVCVVSALNGLRDTIVDLQGRLLDAAVARAPPASSLRISRWISRGFLKARTATST